MKQKLDTTILRHSHDLVQPFSQLSDRTFIQLVRGIFIKQHHRPRFQEILERITVDIRQRYQIGPGFPVRTPFEITGRLQFIDDFKRPFQPALPVSAFVNRHAVIPVVDDMVISLILLNGYIAMRLQENRIFHTGQYPHLPNRYIFIFVHPDSMLLRVHCLLESECFDSLLHFPLHRFVHDFIHIGRQ